MAGTGLRRDGDDRADDAAPARADLARPLPIATASVDRLLHHSDFDTLVYAAATWR